jgi:regulator of replication initiation timing
MYSPANHLQFQNNLQMPGTTVFRFPNDEMSQDSIDSSLSAKKRKSEGILEPTDTRRDSHNVAEKRRRDKINEKIEELSMLISNNPSKSNKASILGNTVEHIQALDARYQELLERNRLLKMENVQLKQAHAKLISSFPHIDPSVALQNHSSDGISVAQTEHDLFMYQQHQLQQHLQCGEALHGDSSYELAQEKAQLIGVSQDAVQAHEQLSFLQFPSAQQYQQFSNHNSHQYSGLQNPQGSFQLPSSFHSLSQFPAHLQHQYVSIHAQEQQDDEQEQVEDHHAQAHEQLEAHQLAVVMQHRQLQQQQQQQEQQDEPRLVQEYQ